MAELQVRGRFFCSLIEARSESGLNLPVLLSQGSVSDLLIIYVLIKTVIAIY